MSHLLKMPTALNYALEFMSLMTQITEFSVSKIA